MRWGGLAGRGAVFGPDDGRHVAGSLPAAADVDHGADEGANHLVAEGAGLDVKTEEAVAEVDPAGVVNLADEGRVGLGQPAERGEVVLADHRVARQRQGAAIERRHHVPRRPGQKGIGHRAVEHGVAVAAGQR